MTIESAQPEDKQRWNKFIKENYPPVGAFMQTWEWGDFKSLWGKKIGRYLVYEGSKLLAVFILAEHGLPMHLSYGYMPRGPVLLKDSSREEIISIFREIKTWVIKNFPQFLFVRLEPPIDFSETDIQPNGFTIPNYYIQPKFNHVVSLDGDSELSAKFHPSTRSNIGRAEKRGVTVQIKNHSLEDVYPRFVELAESTIGRNGGKNIYPTDLYFDALFKSIPAHDGAHDPEKLTLVTYCGYQGEDLAAINYVLFFGDTATYLYGASSSEHLNSKVTTYLHWHAMRHAKGLGFKYYDLGGVDKDLWPSLTNFKHQFNGEDIAYIGNIDIPLSPYLYKLYNLIQKIRR